MQSKDSSPLGLGSLLEADASKAQAAIIYLGVAHGVSSIRTQPRLNTVTTGGPYRHRVAAPANLKTATTGVSSPRRPGQP